MLYLLVEIQRMQKTLAKLQELKGKGTLETGVLDLSDLNSVKEFANIFLQKHNYL